MPITAAGSREHRRPGSGAIMTVLDYARAVTRTGGYLWWISALWSPQRRLQIARDGSTFQAVCIVAVIALAAAVLSGTHAWVHDLIWNTLHRDGAYRRVMIQQLLSGAAAVGWRIPLIAPLVFLALGGLLGLVAWVSGCRMHRSGACFVALVAGSIPLLWFFILLQLEALAPFFSPAPTINAWNPLTNTIRFITLMLALVLAVLWLVDSIGLYRALEGLGPAAPLPPNRPSLASTAPANRAAQTSPTDHRCDAHLTPR